MPVLPLGEVLLPGLPIVFWPAGGHAAVILRGDVDVDQVDPAAAGGFGELQNEDGIGVAFLEHHGAPGLDDDFVRDEQEIMAGEGAAPGGESTSDFAADAGGRAGGRGVLVRVHVDIVGDRGRSVESDGLADRRGHGSSGEVSARMDARGAAEGTVVA